MVRPGAPQRIAALASVLASLALAGAAGASDGTTAPAATTTTADTVTTAPPCEVTGAVAIVQPGAAAVTTLGPSVSAAGVTSIDVPSFADTAYGIQLGRAQVGAAGCVGTGDPGGASARLATWSLFDGAIAGATLRADLVPSPSGGAGWWVRRQVTGLTVDGTPVEPVAGSTAPVGNWATLTIGGRLDGKTMEPLRWWAAALELQLTRPHAGLPAGTIVLIGYAGANVEPLKPLPPKPTTTTTTTTAKAAPAPRPPTTTSAPATTTTAAKPTAHPKPKHKQKARAKPKKPLTHQPLKGTPPLGEGSYVFPIDGHADWGDSYGGERSDVPGGWHHGDDLFAPLGTPVVAVADGTVFAVGWNRVGGWRLWLLDANGNEFYYAHLSGYTGNAKNGTEVRRGEVLGFVGNTGDAVTTLPHLHFEVHPSSLLFLGYDGAVDPTVYLRGFPLAHNVVVPPPVELPSKAPPGRGSEIDFRRLLAVHPLRKPVRAVPAAAPTFHAHPVTNGPVEGSTPVRTAAAPVAAKATASSGSDAAIVVGILLFLAGAGAIVHTARIGRAST